MDPRTEGPLPQETIVERVLFGLSALLFVAYLASRIAGMFTHLFEMGGWETNGVIALQRMLLGSPLYSDPEQAPFEVVQYMPGYFYLADAIGVLLGVDPMEPRSVFLLSRGVSLVFNVLGALVMFLVIRRLQVPRNWAFFLSTLLLLTLHRSSFSRPDSLYLFLGILSAGAYLDHLAQPAGRRAWTGLCISALAGCAALLTKQTGVLILGLPFFHLLIRRRWRELGLFSGIAIAVIGISGALMIAAYGLPVLEKNLVTSLKNGVSLEIFHFVFLNEQYPAIVGFHLIGAVLAWRWIRSGDPVRSFLGWSIPLTFAFALVTGLKAGSRINYFHENFFFIHTAIGVALVTTPASTLRSFWTAVVLVLGAHYMLYRNIAVRDEVGLVDREGPEAYESARAAARYLVEERGLGPDEHVFVRTRGFVEHFLPLNAVLNQKDVVWHSRTRLFDYSAFHRAMDDGSIRFVVATSPTGPIEYLDREFPHFQMVKQVHDHYIFESTATHHP